MRLGLLGPAAQHEQELQRVADFLLDELSVERAVYLGVDRALDDVVHKRAQRLLGSNPESCAVWQRATHSCLRGTPEQIDRFVAAERSCSELRVLESLPSAATRSVEMLDGKLAVMIYDKANLDEEDILAATLLAFGKSREPVVKRVGRRWFLSPGSFATGGLMLLDDDNGGIRLRQFASDCREVHSEELLVEGSPRLRVQGS
jgi:hypothetical protein